MVLQFGRGSAGRLRGSPAADNKIARKTAGLAFSARACRAFRAAALAAVKRAGGRRRPRSGRPTPAATRAGLGRGRLLHRLLQFLPDWPRRRGMRRLCAIFPRKASRRRGRSIWRNRFCACWTTRSWRPVRRKLHRRGAHRRAAAPAGRRICRHRRRHRPAGGNAAIGLAGRLQDREGWSGRICRAACVVSRRRRAALSGQERPLFPDFHRRSAGRGNSRSQTRRGAGGYVQTGYRQKLENI